MLTVHATIEEEIFYPAARLDEAEVEHASAKELIAQIELMKASDPLYDANCHDQDRAPYLPVSVQVLAGLMIQINLILMLFNLLPIPSLDGSHVLWHLVIKGRGHLYPAFYTFARFGLFFLMFLFWIPATSAIFGSVIRGLSDIVIGFIVS